MACETPDRFRVKSKIQLDISDRKFNVTSARCPSIIVNITVIDCSFSSIFYQVIRKTYSSFKSFSNCANVQNLIAPCHSNLLASKQRTWNRIQYSIYESFSNSRSNL